MDAGKDAVLDLTANRRTDEALGSAFTIPIHHVNAGDDVDLVLNDSKNGNDTADSVLVTIKLYDPATAYYHYVFPTGFSPAIGSDDGPKDPCPLTSLCGSGSGKYRTHFRPDAADPNLTRILRAFGTITTEIDSTYDFTDLRAGDDIDVCHVTTGGEEPKTCATTSVNESTHVVSADTTPDKLVHVVARDGRRLERRRACRGDRRRRRPRGRADLRPLEREHHPDRGERRHARRARPLDRR